MPWEPGCEMISPHGTPEALSSQATKARPAPPHQGGGACQRAGSCREEEERNTELHLLQMLNARVFSGSCSEA